jgi:hypothetical protein
LAVAQVLQDAREADVVAADLQRHDLRVGRERVELRRVGARGDVLGRRHVVGLGAAARDVGQRAAERGRGQVGEVAVRAQAAERVELLVEDQRPGGVGVAEAGPVGGRGAAGTDAERPGERGEDDEDPNPAQHVNLRWL